jgi:tetratricopeptide (TPR) repeat protein
MIRWPFIILLPVGNKGGIRLIWISAFLFLHLCGACVLGGRSLPVAGEMEDGAWSRVMGDGCAGAGNDQNRRERDHRSDDTGRDEKRRELDGRLKLAYRLINDGNYEEAGLILENILSSFPGSIRAIMLLAECYVRSGEGEKAVGLLEKLHQKHPDEFDFIKSLGNAYMEIGDRGKAVETWGKLLTGDEDSADFYGVVAQLERDNGLYDEAIETLRRGQSFERHFAGYTREIVKLERILGRQRAAFRDALVLLSRGQTSNLEPARFVLDIFRDTGRSEELISVVDSVAAITEKHGDLFCLVKALLLVEAGFFDRAMEYVAGYNFGERKIKIIEKERKSKDDEVAGEMTYTSPSEETLTCPAPGEESFYSFVRVLNHLKPEDEKAFGLFKRKVYRLYLKMYPHSTPAPLVLLEFARHQRGRAMGSIPPSREILMESIVLADSAFSHPGSAPFRDEILYFKASVLGDDLNMPEEALTVLEGVRGIRNKVSLKSKELLSRILIASGNWERSKKEFGEMAESGDSVVAALGEYQLGRLAFFRGEFDRAVEKLSDFARERTWNKWANDALDWAILLKRALKEDESGGENEGEGKRSLELYRRAILALECGDVEVATSLLGKIVEKYPAASLAPVALFSMAEMKNSAGIIEEAASDFTRLSKDYPLHELAPRAMERAGMINESSEPAGAMRVYEEIMERYPDYPFMERVRIRYVSLSKWMDEQNEVDGEN